MAMHLTIYGMLARTRKKVMTLIRAPTDVSDMLERVPHLGIICAQSAVLILILLLSNEAKAVCTGLLTGANTDDNAAVRRLCP